MNGELQISVEVVKVGLVERTDAVAIIADEDVPKNTLRVFIDDLGHAHTTTATLGDRPILTVLYIPFKVDLLLVNNQGSRAEAKVTVDIKQGFSSLDKYE